MRGDQEKRNPLRLLGDLGRASGLLLVCGMESLAFYLDIKGKDELCMLEGLGSPG